MVLFFGSSVKVAIPLSRIYQIVQTGFVITVNFDCGEVTYMSDYEESVVAPKVASYSNSYESEEIATDVMRSFYVACESGKGAFYF